MDARKAAHGALGRGWSLAIFATALAVRVLYLSDLRGSYLTEVQVGDAAFYDRWAARIAAGEWLGDEPFFLAPLWPYLLGSIYAVFGHEVWLARGLNALLGAGTCALVGAAGAQVLGARAGRAAGLVLALYAPFVWLDGLAGKSALGAFLSALALYAFARSARGTQRVPWCGGGLALGALALVREDAAVLLVVALVWVLSDSAAPAGRRIERAALLMVAFALPLAPAVLRNLRVTGEPVVTWNAGFNFWIGNAPGSDGLYRELREGRGRPEDELADATALAERALGRELAPSEVSGYWLGRGLERVRADPRGWLALVARKAVLVWHAAEFMDTEAMQAATERSRFLSTLASVLHFGVLAPLAALGLLATRAKWRTLWPLYLALGALTASLALFFVFARFRASLIPWLAPFAGAGIAELAALARAPERRRVRASAAVLALAALAVNRPSPEGGDPLATTWSNYGNALLADGRVAEGRALFERAAKHAPDWAAAHYNLAAALALSGDSVGATARYVESARLDPTYATDVHHRLGRLAADAGRMSDALASYRAALTRDPDHLGALLDLAYVLAAHPDPALRDGPQAELLAERAEAHAPKDDPRPPDLLGMALAEQGRFVEALTAARRALAVADPADPEYAAGVRTRIELYGAGRAFRGPR